MRNSVSTPRGVAASILALTGVGSLVLASPAGAAATASNPVITDRETVQVQLGSDGKVDVARLFSQLTVSGDGHYVISDPTSTKAWRNLDGFAKPSFKDGNAVWTIDVHGKTARRSVSEVSSSALPVTVSARYTLDGKQMKPKDLVGKSGTLGVTWTIENITGTPTPISFTDGHGKTISKTVDLVTPYVGQLSTVLPQSFRQIDAARADLAADGHGGTQAVWTMVLFSPIGETTQTFGYTATVKHMALPSATVQVVPVPPQRKPELKFGQDGFAEGAATGAELTDGATQIDSNLIKLRDGAGQLLSGLTQLATGAAQLKAGLAGKAAPGAKQLAAGTSTASAGATKLSTGLSQADAGAQRLADGTDALAGGAAALSDGLGQANAGSQAVADGSQDLAAGAGLVSAGASQLSDGLDALGAGLTQLSTAVSGISSNPGLTALHNGIAAMQAGLGSSANPLTILGALNGVQGGLVQMSTSTTAGLPAVVNGVNGLKTGLGAAKVAIANMTAAVTQQQAALSDALVQGACSANPALPLCVDIATAQGIASAVKDGLSNPNPAQGLGAGVDAALAGIGSSSTPGATVLYGLQAAIAGIGSTSVPGQTLLYGLHQAILGLDHPVGAGGASDHGGVLQGLGAVDNGLTQLVDGIITAVNGALGQPTDAPTASLRGATAALASGASDLADGTASVAGGAGDLALGAAQLADGTNQLDAGGKQLAAGAGQAADGAAQLADGTGQLSSGAGQLAAGLKKINGGASELSTGLSDAATGSGKLADGLNQAKSGGSQIAAGTGKLQAEGTSKLVTAGEDTTLSFGEKLARMKALDEKAADGALPYGAPSGGTGSAAYSYTLAAQTSESHDSMVRALLAVVLLGLTASAATIVRRRVAVVTA